MSLELYLELLFFLFYLISLTLVLRNFRRTSAEDRAYESLADASTTEKIQFYTKALYFGIPAFLIISVWTYFDLRNLEAGTVKSVNLWAPISLVYNFYGYWPAVLVTPLIGLLTVSIFLRKIKSLRNHIQNEQKRLH